MLVSLKLKDRGKLDAARPASAQERIANAYVAGGCERQVEAVHPTRVRPWHPVRLSPGSVMKFGRFGLAKFG